MIKTYSSKVIQSGDIIEIYEYEKPILEGFKNENSEGKGRSSIATEEEKKINREKVLNRARRDLRRLINSNMGDISKFVTLTFADNITDFDVANKEFMLFVKRLSYKLKTKIKYVCVPEFQKRGAIHYHVLMFNIPYIKHADLQEIWGHGFVKINRIINIDNMGAYVCKYMSKDFVEDERMKGKKCYFSSRNLNKPIEIKEKSLVKKLADSLLDTQKTFETTFQNDYNTITYRQYNINEE